MRFIVLPDVIHAASVAARAPGTTLTHPSGRPWIVGEWDDDDLALVEAGERRLALFGVAAVDPQSLRELLVAPGDLLTRLRRVAGSFFVVASIGGRTVARGSASGVRRLFRVRIDGIDVAADRPAALAGLSGTGLDDGAIVRHLLSPGVPWPLNTGCAWRGVDPVDAGWALRWGGDGRATATRWWSAPEQHRSPRDAAADVASALGAAVAARGRAGVSTDLSGGMDSTSLAFLAHASGADVLTCRMSAFDEANDDAVWAREATRALPGLRHLVVPLADVPMNFDGALTPDGEVEAPFGWLRARAMLRRQVEVLAAHGARRHLTGHGGDELFYAMPAHDHDAVRRTPLRRLPRTLAQLHRNRTLRRWGAWRTARYLARGETPAASLRAAAAGLGRPAHVGPSGDGTVSLPPWATASAVEQARAALLAAAATAEPMARGRAAHATLDVVRVCADDIRLADRTTRAGGVSWHAPMLDDQVLDAVLSARPEAHIDAGRYKPLLADAMRGTVPDALLGRPTKAEFSGDVLTGLRRYRRLLVEQCDDLALGRAGVVDPAALRTALLAPQARPEGLMHLVTTITTETWLRSVEAAARPVT